MKKYFIKYGNYVHMYTDIIEFINEDSAQCYALDAAREVGYATLYTNGFDPLNEEEEMSEAEVSEAEEMFVEENCDYFVEEYVPEKHDDEL